MDNIIFERDYRKPTAPDTVPNRHSDAAAFHELLYSTFLKERREKAENPEQPLRTIHPQDKENYERLLTLCDYLAEEADGQIRGVIDYQHWNAVIDTTVSQFMFDPEDGILTEIMEKAAEISFMPAADGQIRMHLVVPYFEELRDSGQNTQDLLELYRFLNDKETHPYVNLLTLLHTMPYKEGTIEKLNAVLTQAEQESGMDKTETLKQVLSNLSEDEMNFDTVLRQTEELLYLSR